jgi:hypothetical protein
MLQVTTWFTYDVTLGLTSPFQNCQQEVTISWRPTDLIIVIHLLILMMISYSNEGLLQWCEMNWVPPGSHASGGLPGWSWLHPKSMTLILWNCNVFFATDP